jgi:hypothetical protein
MVRPTEYTPITLSFEEVAVRAGHEVLMELDDSILLIVDDPQGILYWQLRPHPIHFLNFTLSINYIKLYIIRLLN